MTHRPVFLSGAPGDSGGDAGGGGRHAAGGAHAEVSPGPSLLLAWAPGLRLLWRTHEGLPSETCPHGSVHGSLECTPWLRGPHRAADYSQTQVWPPGGDLEWQREQADIPSHTGGQLLPQAPRTSHRTPSFPCPGRGGEARIWGAQPPQRQTSQDPGRGAAGRKGGEEASVLGVFL